MPRKWVRWNGFQVTMQNMDGPEWGLRTWTYEALNRECKLPWPMPLTEQNLPVWMGWTQKLTALAAESLEVI